MAGLADEIEVQTSDARNPQNDLHDLVQRIWTSDVLSHRRTPLHQTPFTAWLRGNFATRSGENEQL